MPPTNAAPAAAPKDRRIALRQLMGSQKVELLKLLPADKVERLTRIALTECVRNPDLLQCTAESWALALNACAAWGLYPDSSLGYVYLIPRKNNKKPGKPMEVTAMRGYQGDIQLARNTGEVVDLYCEVVYTKDHYVITKGLNRNIDHQPYQGDEDPGPLKAVYAVAKLKSGEVAWVDLTKRDVMRHRAASESAGSDYSPWNKHEAAMWKKSAIRELVKWLPRASEKLEEVIAKIHAEAEADAGRDAKTAVVDVEAVASTGVPMEDQGDALDRLADTLNGGGEETKDEPGAAADCPHPDVPDAKTKEGGLAPGESITCKDCGQTWEGPPLTGAAEGAVVDTSKAAEKKSGQARLANS